MPESIAFCCVNKLLAKNDQLVHSQCLLCALCSLVDSAGLCQGSPAALSRMNCAGCSWPFRKAGKGLAAPISFLSNSLHQLIVYKLTRPLPTAHPRYTSLCLQAVSHSGSSHTYTHAVVISVLGCAWE